MSAPVLPGPFQLVVCDRLPSRRIGFHLQHVVCTLAAVTPPAIPGFHNAPTLLQKVERQFRAVPSVPLAWKPSHPADRVPTLVDVVELQQHRHMQCTTLHECNTFAMV